MTDGRDFDKRAIYRIRVKGHLESKWSDWFDGLAITALANGETLLSGPVADQAALHSLLGRIRDLGLPLLAVHRVVGQKRVSRSESAADVIHSEEGEEK